jgi:hypothetical protein
MEQNLGDRRDTPLLALPRVTCVDRVLFCANLVGMADKLTLTVTAEGELLIGPGHAFGDEDVPMMVEAAGAVSDVLRRRAGKSSAPWGGER